MKFDFGVAFAPARGEVICGDGCAIVERPDEWWVCVVDGLGHGPMAADASRAATEFVREHPDPDLVKMIVRLGDVLKPTRGAAVSLVYCERTTGAMRFAGVGNVELYARTRTPFSPIAMPGVVGRVVRKMLVSQHQLVPGDLLVLATDGLSSRIDLRNRDAHSMPALADLLLAEYGRRHDDALCVSIRVSEGTT